MFMLTFIQKKMPRQKKTQLGTMVREGMKQDHKKNKVLFLIYFLPTTCYMYKYPSPMFSGPQTSLPLRHSPFSFCIDKMQSQPQRLQPSWPDYNLIHPSSDQYLFYGVDMDLQMGDCEFSPSVATTEDSFNISSIPYFSVEDVLDLPLYGGVMPFENSLNLEEFGYTSNSTLSTNESDDISQWMELRENMFISEDSPNEEEEEEKASLSSSTNMCSVESSPIVQPSLILPTEGMDIDNEIVIPHLLKGYGDAMGGGEQELAEVIVKRIREKVSPSGASVERLGYYLFESLDKQGDYLKQESSKNYEAAFKAFYQIFPYGRFVHFTANLAILESMPKDAETVHIIDFDMGDGLQWPPLIEAMGQHKSIRLTSVKRNEDNCDQSLPQWRFEDTKRQLDHHAISLGLKLEVDEMNMEEISNLKKLGKGSEWLAINCMLGLPHMGRSSSRRNAMEFLMVAKELIAKSSTRGILVLGDGGALNQSVGSCSSFGSFFDEHLVHYNAMLESIDWHFPAQLTEAKIAMECLFLAPNVSSDTCFQSWKDSKEQCGVKFGLDGWRFSRENVMHAKEMVKDGEGLYEVKLQGENENEMVLEWRGASLVKVSTWR